MGSSKPQPVKAPFEQKQQEQQQTANTYGRFSVADSPEGQDFLKAPLDFGGSYAGLNTNVDVDPGVGHRTALAEQGVNNRYDSAFNGGVPAWIREMNRAKEVREVQGQGAAEARQAQYMQQQGQRGLEYQKAQLVEGANQDRQMAELDRRRILLPNILQTGGTSSGSGSSSGFNTQIVQPQPGFWQRAALTAIGGASSGLRLGSGG